MAYYEVAGRSLATAATANHCAAQVWNPSTTRDIYVVEIFFQKTVATADHHMVSRSSARGATPTVTETPDADNDYMGSAAPPSAFVLELGTFGTQPTLATPTLRRGNLPAAIGPGNQFIFAGQGIRLPAGNNRGLCIATPVATVLQPIDVTVVVFD